MECGYSCDWKKKDLKALAAAWEKLIENGETSLLGGLGEIYERGGLGVERNATRAIACYTRGIAARDDADCHLGLGRCFYIGNGVAQDISRAKSHFDRAAALGNSAAHLYLGRIYFIGFNAPIDLNSAKFHLNLAIKSEFVSAYILMSKIEWINKRFLKSIKLRIDGMRLGAKLFRKNPADTRLL